MIINEMPGLALGKTTANASTIINGYTAYNGDGNLMTGTASAGITPSGAELTVTANANFSVGDYGQLTPSIKSTSFMISSISGGYSYCPGVASSVINDNRILILYGAYTGNTGTLRASIVDISVNPFVLKGSIGLDGASTTTDAGLFKPCNLLKISDTRFLAFNYYKVFLLEVSGDTITRLDTKTISGSIYGDGRGISAIAFSSTSGQFVYSGQYYADCSLVKYGPYLVTWSISGNTLTLTPQSSADGVTSYKKLANGNYLALKNNNTYNVLNSSGAVIAANRTTTTGCSFLFYDSDFEGYVVRALYDNKYYGDVWSFDGTDFTLKQQQAYLFNLSTFPANYPPTTDIGAYLDGPLYFLIGYMSYSTGYTGLVWTSPTMGGITITGAIAGVYSLAPISKSRGVLFYHTYNAQDMVVVLYGDWILNKPSSRTSAIVKDTVSSGSNVPVYLTTYV